MICSTKKMLQVIAEREKKTYSMNNNTKKTYFGMSFWIYFYTTYDQKIEIPTIPNNSSIQFSP